MGNASIGDFCQQCGVDTDYEGTYVSLDGELICYSCLCENEEEG